MRYIAHRILKDGVPLEALDVGRIAAHDGVELDLRLGVDGDLLVRHSPLFGGRRLHRRGIGHCFDAVSRRLEALAQRPRLLLLDVKCANAARSAARRLAASGGEGEAAFVCWHEAEVRAVREALPDARILFCVAPIVAKRDRERAEFYLANSFPFLWAAERFMPQLDKHNRHNINVKFIGPGRDAIPLPEAVDGICLHRVFWRPEIAAMARAQGLSVAVYGLHSRAQAAEAAAVGAIDLAVMGVKRRARSEEAGHSRPIAA